MNKNNNKGFMLLETLIVSTVILGTLVFLYVQFVNVKSNYEISFRYNTIPGLYSAKEISSYLEEIGYAELSDLLDTPTNANNGYINITTPTVIRKASTDLYNNLISKTRAKTVLFVPDDISTLKNNLSINQYDKTLISEDFKRYILKLSTSSLENKKRLIIEFNDQTYASIIVGGGN